MSEFDVSFVITKDDNRCSIYECREKAVVKLQLRGVAMLLRFCFMHNCEIHHVTGRAMQEVARDRSFLERLKREEALQ